MSVLNFDIIFNGVDEGYPLVFLFFFSQLHAFLCNTRLAAYFTELLLYICDTINVSLYTLVFFSVFPLTV